MTDEVRIGLLGCGRIGRMHANLVEHQVAGASVTTVFDVADDASAGVAAATNASVAASAEAVLRSDRVDAVAICTSTETHAELIVAAAEAGKAIFCEKPVSLDLAAVDRASAAVNAAGVPFQVGFNRRFDASHRAVRRAVLDGRVGEPHLVRITSRDPAPPPIDYIETSGGIFLDMTIHDFDMARYVTGRDVEVVYATGSVRIDPAIGAAGDLDTVVVVLTHENGAITTIDNSRQAAYGYDQRVEVFGSAGMVTSENPLVHTTVVRDADGMRAAALPYFFLDRYIPSYIAEWRAFVDAVKAGTQTEVGVEDARAPLAIGLAACKSVREKRPVAVSEVG